LIFAATGIEFFVDVPTLVEWEASRTGSTGSSGTHSLIINEYSDSTFSTLIGMTSSGLGAEIFNLAPGYFRIQSEMNDAFSRSLAGNADWSFRYVVSQATVVPLPAALPLFGTGLGLLGFLGWRRRRRLEAV
jgi:hypothetical protein